MQLLCLSSTEFGFTKGLGLIGAKVDEWKNLKKNLFDIHIGFNSVRFDKNMKLFRGLKNNSDFYFVHSYYANPSNKIKGKLGHSYFNSKFISSFEENNVFATQFHPEKSHENGLKVLKNFCEL